MSGLRGAGAAGDIRAQAAIEIFCYRVRKYVGSYSAALGGLNAVVFTAGIGENDSLVRERSLEGLEYLGIAVDPEKNNSLTNERDGVDISCSDRPVRVAA